MPSPEKLCSQNNHFRSLHSVHITYMAEKIQSEKLALMSIFRVRSALTNNPEISVF